MAADCLAAFAGDVVVHVGEWLGDTGNAAFERALAAGWQLQVCNMYVYMCMYSEIDRYR